MSSEAAESDLGNGSGDDDETATADDADKTITDIALESASSVDPAVQTQSDESEGGISLSAQVDSVDADLESKEVRQYLWEFSSDSLYISRDLDFRNQPTPEFTSTRKA